ncbi:unnamed protein product [Protopolystoma xenopodis]|uniref:Uncharacterized protein n=1 Tax=Protopolystoma xenopodis TaxID=117903 RepID=A0A3S5FG98_9PLAT|nr:unnamed protein product [Protopolystoma xenopodis]
MINFVFQSILFSKPTKFSRLSLRYCRTAKKSSKWRTINLGCIHPNGAGWLAFQAAILHCRGSPPAEGVDKTDARRGLRCDRLTRPFRSTDSHDDLKAPLTRRLWGFLLSRHSEPCRMDSRLPGRVTREDLQGKETETSRRPASLFALSSLPQPQQVAICRRLRLRNLHLHDLDSSDGARGEMRTSVVQLRGQPMVARSRIDSPCCQPTANQRLAWAGPTNRRLGLPDALFSASWSASVVLAQPMRLSSLSLYQTVLPTAPPNLGSVCTLPVPRIARLPSSHIQRSVSSTDVAPTRLSHRGCPDLSVSSVPRLAS